MLKINFFFAVFVILAFGCNDTQHALTEGNNDIAKDTSQAINRKNQIDSFYLSNDTLLETQEIIVSLPNNHPNKFAIVNPTGEYFYLQDSPDITYLSSNDSINLMRKFILKQDQKGILFQDGEKVESKIFVKEGFYHLINADNLETGPENTNYLEKTIYYKK